MVLYGSWKSTHSNGETNKHCRVDIAECIEDEESVEIIMSHCNERY